MMDLDWIQIALVVLCAIAIGFAKTGVPALGILVVAVMASVFPARESIGIVLPMLIIGDIVAVTYYRHNVVWKTLISLLPWVTGGLVVGFLLLFFVETSRSIEVILGSIIVILIVLHVIKARWGAIWLENIPQSKSFLGTMGTISGFTSMIGNAGGPIMTLYLLAKGLPKKEFIGTGAWFFMAVNLIKVPLYIYLGLITSSSLTLNILVIPVILLGTVIGIKVLPLIPQKHFNIVILILAAFGGIRLLYGG